MPSEAVKTTTPRPRPWGPDRLYKALQTYVLFLRGLFRANDPGQWRWLPNDNESEIIITGRSPLDLEANQKRPAIVVVRKAAVWANMSLDGVQRQSFVNEERRHTDLVSSAMVIHCLAREGEIANQIAWTVFRAIPLFQRVLNTNGQLHAVTRKLQMGEETDPGSIVQGDSEPRWIDVTVTSPFYVQETTDVTERADSDFQTILNSIRMTIESSLPEAKPPSSTRATFGGPVVDVSRELPGGANYNINPPMWKGRPLRGVTPEPRPPSERTEPIEQGVVVDSE